MSDVLLPVLAVGFVATMFISLIVKFVLMIIAGQGLAVLLTIVAWLLVILVGAFLATYVIRF